MKEDCRHPYARVTHLPGMLQHFPALALGARPGEAPAPGEQLWVPLPSDTPEVKPRES